MRILITGGTGSLGHALVDHYLKNTDHRLIVLSRDELKQAQMREEFPDGRLDFFLGDVRDLQRLELAFEAHIDVVLHAAALKRIDSVCNDPDEVFKTNILGSRNVLHAARGRVKKCLLISTDKACYPINAYGLSKAMGEHLFIANNVYGKPKDSASSVVRYGNVMGSRGSVIERWRLQKANGEPLKITHPEMTRFLITLPQAVQMIETALTAMTGGETFVPRLTAVKMEALASAIAGPSYPQETVGLRPGGEKMHETLMTDEETERAMEYGPDPHFAIIYPDMGGTRGGGIGKYGWRSDRAPQVENLAKLLETL